MARIKDYQEVTRYTLVTVEEIKDDVERLFELGEFSQIGLFDLYQKIDILSDCINMIATMGLEEDFKTTSKERRKEEAQA